MPAHAHSPIRIPAAVVAGSCPTPQWPSTRMRLEEIRPTRVAFRISADGRVQGATVEQSAGGRPWDQAVIRALSRCRFLPARNGDGRRVPGIVNMTHVWTLD